MTHFDYAILADPLMRVVLERHRAERRPCIFCDGAYYASVVFYDLDLLTPNGIFIATYDVCESCLARGDFRDMVCAEYLRDLPSGAQSRSRMAKYAWLN
jgi:hypothetical protein